MLEETLKEQLRICAEHGAENYNDEIKCQALVSIAISLKRIADSMTMPPPKMPELTPEQVEEFKKEMDKDFAVIRNK